MVGDDAQGPARGLGAGVHERHALAGEARDRLLALRQGLGLEHVHEHGLPLADDARVRVRADLLDHGGNADDERVHQQLDVGPHPPAASEDVAHGGKVPEEGHEAEDEGGVEEGIQGLPPVGLPAVLVQVPQRLAERVLGDDVRSEAAVGHGDVERLRVALAVVQQPVAELAQRAVDVGLEPQHLLSGEVLAHGRAAHAVEVVVGSPQGRHGEWVCHKTEGMGALVTLAPSRGIDLIDERWVIAVYFKGIDADDGPYCLVLSGLLQVYLMRASGFQSLTVFLMHFLDFP